MPPGEMSALTPDLQASRQKRLSIVISAAKAHKNKGWYTKMVTWMRKDLGSIVAATFLGREAVP